MPVPLGIGAVAIARLIAAALAKEAAKQGVKKLAAAETRRIVRQVAAKQGIKRVSDREARAAAARAVGRAPYGRTSAVKASGGRTGTRSTVTSGRTTVKKAEGPRLNKEQLQASKKEKLQSGKTRLRQSLRTPPKGKTTKNTKIMLPKGIPTRAEMESAQRIAKYRGQEIDLSPAQMRAIYGRGKPSSTIEQRIAAGKESRPTEISTSIRNPSKADYEAEARIAEGLKKLNAAKGRKVRPDMPKTKARAPKYPKSTRARFRQQTGGE